MPLARDLLTERRNPKRYRISLTPLADAMFNLLIFFMLSSNITPYSLLPLKGTVALPGDGAGAGDGLAQPSGADAAVWTVTKGEIIANGQLFSMDQADDLTDILTQAGTQSIVLVIRPEAEVQDLTTVLEALSAGGITQVQLSGRGV
jgi:biopolymer transport protein ExbD